MPHLWLENPKGTWIVFQLRDSGFSLRSLPPCRIEPSAGEPHVVSLLPALAHGESTWVLIAPVGANVRVNGRLLRTGLRVLADRDEVDVGGAGTFFFSTESLARIERLPASERTIHCARCKVPIERETPAVRCPACHVWHHQGDEYPCWTYSDNCALCSQPTRLDAGFRWTPAEVWA